MVKGGLAAADFGQHLGRCEAALVAGGFVGDFSVVVEHLVDGLGIDVAFFHPPATSITVFGGAVLLGA